MKKVIIAFTVALIWLLSSSTVAFAGDGDIQVDIVVLGDDPTVTVEANGDGATVFINGRNINYPEIQVFASTEYIENSYDDATLRQRIDELNAVLDIVGYNITVTEDGLAKVILVIQEHTRNMSDLVDKVNQVQDESVDRDNNLNVMYQNQIVDIVNLGHQLEQEKVARLDADQKYQTRLIWLGSVVIGIISLYTILFIILFARTRHRAI